jgi:hypothetical protein
MFSNPFKKKPSLLAQHSAKLIMNLCTLQLQRGESVELAPTPGATGPITLSGGSIATVSYRVFDKHADKIDPAIRKEPWRAYALVTMHVSMTKDPEFKAVIEGHEIKVDDRHKNPGLQILKHLFEYFPLIPKPFQGQVYAPQIEASK